MDPLKSVPRRVPIDAIRPSPLNPRRYHDPAADEDLRESMKRRGLLVRPIVRAISDPLTPFEIVAGERRLRAAKSLGWKELLVSHMPDLDGNDALAFEVSLYENLDRVDPNPYEETMALLRVLHYHLERFSGWQPGPDPVRSAADFLRRFVRGKEARQEEMAAALGVSRKDLEGLIEEVCRRRQGLKPISIVTNRLSLLDLPQDVKDVLVEGRLDYTAARQIGRVQDPVHRSELLAKASQLSGRELRAEIRALERADAASDQRAQRAAEIRGLLTSLSGRTRALEGLSYNDQTAVLAALRRLDGLLPQ